MTIFLRFIVCKGNVICIILLCCNDFFAIGSARRRSSGFKKPTSQNGKSTGQASKPDGMHSIFYIQNGAMPVARGLSALFYQRWLHGKRGCDGPQSACPCVARARTACAATASTHSSRCDRGGTRRATRRCRGLIFHAHTRWEIFFVPLHSICPSASSLNCLNHGQRHTFPTERSPARSGRLRGRAGDDHCRCRLGQDANPHLPHRAPHRLGS